MAQQVTELLVRMGQQGQIRGKVTDEALKGLLEQVSGFITMQLYQHISDEKVSNPAPVKSSTPAAPPSARTKTLGGGITVSITRLRDMPHALMHVRFKEKPTTLTLTNTTCDETLHADKGTRRSDMSSDKVHCIMPDASDHVKP